MDPPLVAALPTGRLLRAVTGLLERAGVPLPEGSADRRLRLRDDGMEVLFAKDRDVPIYVEHGKRLAPIPLAAEQPVPELIVHRAFAVAVFLQPDLHPFLGLGHIEAV